MAYRTYNSDPRWIVAKYPGTCRDGRQFRRGDRVFYYPNSRTFLTGDAAEQAALDFDAARFDEDIMGNGCL